MLKISEFSRLTQTSVKTLRYYDELGLLRPAHVDSWTGYRYYSAAQLPRLNRILALKALGLSLEQIGSVLDDGLTVEQMRGMLRLKQAELQGLIDAERQRLLFVEARLQQIEQEGTMSQYEVIVKPVPAFTVASLQGTVADQPHLSSTLPQLFGEVHAFIRQTGAGFSMEPGRCGITMYLDEEWTGSDIHVEVAEGIERAVPSSERVRVYDLPAVEQMASVVHTGPFSGVGAAYDALSRWIDANGYRIIGPAREISLAFDPQGDPAQWVTEIQFPVSKA